MFVTYLVIAFLYDNKWRYNCDRIVDTGSLSQASQMFLQGDLFFVTLQITASASRRFHKVFIFRNRL